MTYAYISMQRPTDYTLCYLHSKCSTISEASHAPMIERISAHVRGASAKVMAGGSFPCCAREILISRPDSDARARTRILFPWRYSNETLYQELQIKQSHLHDGALARWRNWRTSRRRQRKSMGEGFLWRGRACTSNFCGETPRTPPTSWWI